MMKENVVPKLCAWIITVNMVFGKIIRIFNTYGPNMLTDDGRVISNFVVQALQDKDITIYGDGKQTRSFQYIDDLVEGMMRMMATEDHFTGPVNIGNPCEFSIFELAQKILELTCSHSNIISNLYLMMTLVSAGRILLWQEKSWIGSLTFIWKRG